MERIKIIKGDITELQVEAIVNAANNSLMGGGGVDGAIHRTAGRELLEECRRLKGCRTGEAKLTGGYELPAEYVIHTVGPVWQGGDHREAELLAACYRNSLKLALENKITSIAFPAISTGVYGYPLEEASNIAVETAINFLKVHYLPEKVTFVCFSERSYQIYLIKLRDCLEAGKSLK